MINLSQILGRVGKIETITSPKGLKISNLSMVTSKKYTKDGEKQEKVTWHNVTFYSKLAEVAEKYVHVGDRLYIRGEMDCQKYKDSSGADRVKYSVIGHELQLMPKVKPLASGVEDFGSDEGIPW